jgi:hypothetical protein
MRIVVVGGGWAGCAAALAARKRGAEVMLLERTDMLLGTGLVGGIMRNNGRFTATEELIAMSGGELFQLIDTNLLHKNIAFPGHHHASLYNVATMEPLVKKFLQQKGVEIQMGLRVTDVEMGAACLLGVTGRQAKQEVYFQGDAFIDATGTAGPPANCAKYGNGCAMCVLRCHSFGGRVSLAAKAGCREMNGEKNGQLGAFSGSCKLHKESLSQEIRHQLETRGVVVVPVCDELKVKGKLSLKACQQYATAAFEENVVLLDTGHAKLMSPFFPLERLRRIPGFENARYEDPYAGGIGNSVRYFGMPPRDDTLHVNGVDNLFCAGEKAGLLVGHTEAICTGTLAGHNAVSHVKNEKPLTLPTSLAIGDAIGHVREQMMEKQERGLKFTFSGSVYFERMTALGLYTTDQAAIAKRVKACGMDGIFR